MYSNVLLIKLGGSVITHKEKPMSINKTAIDKILKTLSSIRIPIVLIHGGGSFGHYWSIKYNMHSKPERYSAEGISVVHESMISLNHIIVKSMLKIKMNPYSVPPSFLFLGNKLIPKKITEFANMTKDQIIPITYGDVIYRSNHRYSILSGDELMTIISSVLRPKKIIFTVNVDGIYKNFQSKEIIKSFDEKIPVKFSDINLDITGGMHRKVLEALKISHEGIDVHIVNGFKPGRILKILQNKNTEGTVIKGKRSST